MRHHGNLSRLANLLTERPFETVSSAGRCSAEVGRMQGQIGRLWRLRRGAPATEAPARGPNDLPLDATRTADVAANLDQPALPDPGWPDAPPPEQPVLLMPSGVTRPVRVGEVLPARRRTWPLSVVRLPVIPKRAILAVGVCAGLAAPTLVRHLATRIIFGQPAAPTGGILEVTRIVYTGPLTPRAATAVSKLLDAGRR